MSLFPLDKRMRIHIIPMPPRWEGYLENACKSTIFMGVIMKNQNALRRLKTIEGHVRGVIRMVEEDGYCIDVIRQIQAVGAALNKVSAQILENHLSTCVIPAIRGDDAGARERVLKEITEVFDMANKV